MDHILFRDKIDSYINGGLDGDELAAFEIHFYNCLDCRKYLIKQKSMYALINKSILSLDESNMIEIFGSKSILKQIIDEGAQQKIVNKNTDKPSLRSKLIDVINKISAPKSNIALGLSIVQADAVKGDKKTNNIYKVGEIVIISIDTPKNGYLTLLHYDDHYNLRMIYPDKEIDEAFQKAGEVKRIPIKAKPKGKHYLKALLTSRQLIEQDNLYPHDDELNISAIGKVLESVNGLDDDEWIESIAEFEVV